MTNFQLTIKILQETTILIGKYISSTKICLNFKSIVTCVYEAFLLLSLGILPTKLRKLIVTVDKNYERISCIFFFKLRIIRFCISGINICIAAV